MGITLNAELFHTRMYRSQDEHKGATLIYDYKDIKYLSLL